MTRFAHTFIGGLIFFFLFAFVGWWAFGRDSHQIYTVVIHDALHHIPAHQAQDGLKVNAPVRFNNIVVGKIKHIAFNPKNPRQVTLQLAIDNMAPITKGTRASLSPQAHLHLTDQGHNTVPLTVMAGQQFPMIAMQNNPALTLVAASNTLAMIDGKPSTSNDPSSPQAHPTSATQSPTSNTPTEPSATTQALQDISQALKKQNDMLATLFNDDNSEAIKQLLFSIKEVASVLSANKENINSLLEDLDDFTDGILPLFDGAKSTLRVLNSQTLPHAYLTMSNLNESLALVRELLVDLNANPTMLIRGKCVPKLGPGEVVRYNKCSPTCQRQHQHR